MAQWNGTRWFDLNGGIYGDVSSVAATKTALYVGFYGGPQSHAVMRWEDSEGWSAVGTELDGVGVEVLAIWGNDLYAGGTFKLIDGIGFSGASVRKWDGSKWSQVGYAPHTDPRSPPFDDTGAVSALGAGGYGLFASGVSFPHAGTPYSWTAQVNNGNWNIIAQTAMGPLTVTDTG